ncbi:hypothetical protein EPI10_010928 [Gossypium australe]|uniref:Integrase n=1 Tax=Gossypium australe TaxID=47621 RepID=A0A5B6W7C7_9ROSI|nr:hypothetical protein EPI10_010928 [Gossypium australe]
MYNDLKQFYWWKSKLNIKYHLVVVDRLTKCTQFIPVRIDYSLDRLAELFEIYVAILEETARSFGYEVEFQYSFSSSD